MVDGVAESADARSSLMGPRQQLMRVVWGAPRAVGIADAMPATLLPQMLAQQLAGAQIEQAHEHRVPLHMELTPDPAWRRSVVSRLDDAAIEMNRALTILVVRNGSSGNA